MLEKKTKIDLIEVMDNGCVQLKIKTLIYENSQLIGSAYSFQAIVPGADYSNEEARVKAICSVVHTPEVIAEYQSMLQAPKAEV
jgi:hypothetical protein